MVKQRFDHGNLGQQHRWQVMAFFVAGNKFLVEASVSLPRDEITREHSSHSQ